MNAFTWIGISFLLIGGIVVVKVAPTILTLERLGRPLDKYRTRHGIGLGLTALGAVLMNFGTLTSGDVGVVMKIVAAAATLILLGTLVWVGGQGRRSATG